MKLLDHYGFQLKTKQFKPLIVGGMGVDISTSNLALAACKMGGIGHISDAMSPYVADKKFKTHFQQEKYQKFAHLRKTEEKTGLMWEPDNVYKASLLHVRSTMDAKKGAGAVFVNVMEKLTMGAPKETLEARLRGALDGGIDGVTLSAGLHKGSLKLVEDHPRFNDVYFGIIVSSVRALQVFLRASSRVNRLPDYIIVEGPLAGGHLGFGMDWEKFQLKEIFNDVMSFLKIEELNIPAIPAGGIFTGQEAVSFIELGASAVQVATRFTITEECGLPAFVKQEYLRAEPEDVVVNLSSPTGYPIRMLSYSPSLKSNVRPNCEALGYMLDSSAKCSYRDAYNATPLSEKNKKLPVVEKMCICHHFMQYSCYTCGANVHRLKEITKKNIDGSYILPTAEEVFNSYLYGE